MSNHIRSDLAAVDDGHKDSYTITHPDSDGFWLFKKCNKVGNLYTSHSLMYRDDIFADVYARLVESEEHRAASVIHGERERMGAVIEMLQAKEEEPRQMRSWSPAPR